MGVSVVLATSSVVFMVVWMVFLEFGWFLQRSERDFWGVRMVFETVRVIFWESECFFLRSVQDEFCKNKNNLRTIQITFHHDPAAISPCILCIKNCTVSALKTIKT